MELTFWDYCSISVSSQPIRLSSSRLGEVSSRCGLDIDRLSRITDQCIGMSLQNIISKSFFYKRRHKGRQNLNALPSIHTEVVYTKTQTTCSTFVP